LEGLRRLEYRGYDSAGIALVGDQMLEVVKAAGKVSALQEAVSERWPEEGGPTSSIGIAHTRWATHGPPTETNAHPHVDGHCRFALVHNGIIENYTALKDQMTQRGRVFYSDTDTEVLVQLIASCYEGDIIQATAAALKQVEGTFGIAVISRDEPERMVVARRGSPIVIGLGRDETIVASDVSALVAYTDRVIYLDDDDIAVITPDNVDLRNIDNVPVSREVAHIDWDTSAAEKSGYDHFMLKEIFEQPTALANTIRGRLDDALGTTVLNSLELNPHDLALINRVVLAACGTSLHASMVGEYFLEDLADIPTEVEQAAEFRYRNPIIGPHNLIVAVSQSGETADTLAAVREAQYKGGLVASICNVVGSTIARETGRTVYLHAGPEIGVASTKAFTCQVTVLLMLALRLGRTRRLSLEAGLEIIDELRRLPELVQTVADRAPAIEEVARKYSQAEGMFFIGRGYLFPVALEGALKIKEISYIHAEGYHAAELKHGPIALLEESVPVVALANDVPGRAKVIGNMQECRARKSPVIATATDGDPDVAQHANDVIWIPPASRFVTPVLTAVALQLFAYYFARERGCPIDQPRNLAKSVTVE
jgi:glucosamine--fructose-6-phosphate aminotransferase (isomerizing)